MAYSFYFRFSFVCTVLLWETGKFLFETMNNGDFQLIAAYGISDRTTGNPPDHETIPYLKAMKLVDVW